jgi:hypothetical protein
MCVQGCCDPRSHWPISGAPPRLLRLWNGAEICRSVETPVEWFDELSSDLFKVRSQSMSFLLPDLKINVWLQWPDSGISICGVGTNRSQIMR